MAKKYFIVIGVGVLLTLGLTTLYFFKKTSTDHSIHTELNDLKKTSKYICPMHPQITSDKAGSCPICGMDLVLATESDEHDDHEDDEHKEATKNSDWEDVGDTPEKQDHNIHSSASHEKMKTEHLRSHTKFKLSLNKQQMIGVKITTVEKKKLFKSIRAPGRIAFDPELYTAQSEYLEALRQWNRIQNSPLEEVRQSTREMIRSAKIRLKVLGLSDSQIKSLARKGAQSEGLLVTGKGQDNWVYADIFEMDLPYIEKGLSAQITANFLQGKTLPGKVISVDQVISPDTRTAKVRIQLKESDPSIRPESYVNVTIFAPLGERTAVPLEAIMDTGRETFVFVKKEKGKFEPRKVTIGLETDEHAAISRGLMEGEKVVVGGNFMLDSESRLKAVIQGASSSDEHQH